MSHDVARIYRDPSGSAELWANQAVAGLLTGHTCPVSSCWESGGPDWFFSAILESIMVAAVAAVWWIMARNPRPGRGQRVRRVTSYLVYFAFFGSVLAVSGSGSFDWAMAFVAALLATASWGIAEALRREEFAAEDGGTLAGGWGMAYRTIRPGVPTLFILAVASAIGFITASELLGHPCS